MARNSDSGHAIRSLRYIMLRLFRTALEAEVDPELFHHVNQVT